MSQPQKAALRVPPQNLDAERALLGSLMVRSSAIHDVSTIVRPEDFYAEKHKLIYQSMLDLTRKSEPIDIVTMSGNLSEHKSLDAVGGGSYLSELLATVPASTNAEYYAIIVSKKSALRGLIHAGDKITELGFQEADEIENVLDQAERTVMEVTGMMRHNRKSLSMKDLVPEAWETMLRLHEHTGELRGVPSGFRDLDSKLSGFQKADLVILAARPSMGKTSFALDIARQAALNHNVPVGIFSLEMNADSLVHRMLSAEAKVDSWKMRTGRGLTDDDFERLQEASVRLSKAPIYIEDDSSATVLTMRAVARRLKNEHNLGLLIVDYLQLLSPTKNYDSMVNQVSEISRGLKGLARELEVPIIALSQLSRAVEARGGKPRLSDLRDSGAIEQDADVVMFIHREDKYQESPDRPNIAEILIEKHRNGPTGLVELYFDGSKTTFVTIEKNEFTDFASQTPHAEPF